MSYQPAYLKHINPRAIAAGQFCVGKPIGTYNPVSNDWCRKPTRRREMGIARAVVGTFASFAIAPVIAGATSAAGLGLTAPAASTAPAWSTLYPATQGAAMSMFGDMSSWGSLLQTGLDIYSATRRPTSPMMQTMGALPPVGGAVVRSLPGMIGFGAGVAVARAGAIARSAMSYCRRNPAWCAQIGGTAAIAGLIESGQLPTIRRRRGRGITPRDLRSFRRVANLVRGFCPTVRRVPTRALHVRRTGTTHAS